MQVAALYDIHGNLPALEAVLAEIRAAQVDAIVIGGDVLPGPMPCETLELLAALPIPTHYIYGNGEVAVLQQMAGQPPAAVPLAFRPIIEWNAAQLGSRHRQSLSAWPKTLRLAIDGLGDVLFCHATPRNENEIFTCSTPQEKLRPVFSEGAPLVVCGHTHMQFDRRVGSTRVVNAGSVGMPFGEPGAYWLLLGRDVLFRCTSYDLSAACNRIRATAYPHADEFASRSILHPPSAADMLKAFSSAELR